MRPWTAILLFGLLGSRAFAQNLSTLPSQSALYGAQQTAASLSTAPLRATQRMTSDCSSFPFQVSTSVYAIGSSAGTDLASALTSCLGQTVCQVSVSMSASCSMGSILHANSLSPPQQNCTASEQPMYVCKNFAVSPVLYQSVQSGSCVDDFQQQTVSCSGSQLQRSLYQAILSGNVMFSPHLSEVNTPAQVPRMRASADDGVQVTESYLSVAYGKCTGSAAEGIGSAGVLLNVLLLLLQGSVRNSAHQRRPTSNH